MPPATPHADVSVRPSISTDADAIAAIQTQSWRSVHAQVLPQEVLVGFDTAAMATQWRQAIDSPPNAAHAVVTALAHDEIVGFAAVTPQGLIALEVKSDAQREGHGSRLLAACVDRLRADGMTDIVTWVAHHDQARQQFLASAGLTFTGRTRGFEIPPATASAFSEERWAAAIS